MDKKLILRYENLEFRAKVVRELAMEMSQDKWLTETNNKIIDELIYSLWETNISFDRDDIKDIEFCWIVDYLPYCDGMNIIYDFETNTKHRVYLLESGN